MRQVFETSDLGVAGGVFGDLYTSMRMRASDHEPLMRAATTRVGRARLDRTTLELLLDGVASPQDTVYVVGVRSGAVKYTATGFEDAAGSRGFCYSVPSGLSLDITMHNADSDVVALAPCVMNDVAGFDPVRTSAVRLLSTRPHSVAATARLWRTGLMVEQLLAGAPDDKLSPSCE